jgi:hypothetical protein
VLGIFALHSGSNLLITTLTDFSNFGELIVKLSWQLANRLLATKGERAKRPTGYLSSLHCSGVLNLLLSPLFDSADPFLSAKRDWLMRLQI